MLPQTTLDRERSETSQKANEASGPSVRNVDASRSRTVRTEMLERNERTVTKTDEFLHQNVFFCYKFLKLKSLKIQILSFSTSRENKMCSVLLCTLVLDRRLRCWII